MDPINRPGIGSVGVIGASPNASGASITGNVLTLQPASTSFGGVLTSGTQTIAGAKTFTGAQAVSNQLATGTSISTFSQLAIGSSGGISGTTQLALFASFTGTSSATLAIRGAQFSIATPAVAMTCAEVTGFTCANNSAGVGSTITRSQGIVISPQNAGTNNCAILHDFSTAYTGNWFIRDEGTYPSRFGGAVTIADSTASTSTTTGALVITGGVGIGGRLNVGGAVQIAITGATLGVSTQARIDAPNSNFGPALALVADSIGRGINLYSAGYINGTSGDALTIQTVSGGAQINTTTAGAGSSGTLTLISSTASTSTTTGALVATGGVGVGGRLNVGSTTIIGTDPGGSELLRVGGSIRCTSALYITGASSVPVLNSTAATDATLSAYFSFQRNAIERGWIGYGDAVSGKMKLYNSIGDIFLSPLAAVIIGTDPGGSETVRIGGTLAVNSATLIRSYTTLTDGAGVAVGTLTNAPTAGNPTKWVLINDNGTIRKFPTWT